LSLEGENIAGINGFYYKLGYQNQAEGDADINADRQTGYAMTLGHEISFNERIALDGLIEFVDINNVDGASVDSQYITTNLVTTIDEMWNVTVSYTARDIETGANDVEDHLLQISGGYDFGQGTTAEIGYRYAEELGSETNIIGGLIRHAIEF